MSTYDRLTSGCSLTDLIERVQPLTLDVVQDPPRPADEVMVRGTIIEGPGERLPDFPGAILLLVAGALDVRLLEPTVLDAARAGYSAVVVRAGAPGLAALAQAAAGAGIALLAFDGELNWRELAALVDAVIETHMALRDRTPGQGGDELYMIADAVAATIGGSVSIEDLSQRVVAYSSVPGQRIDAVRSEGILGRSAPPDPGDRERYGSILRSNGVVRFEREGDELARAAMAIKAGDLPLGTIWAIEGESGITARDEIALEEGARLAALHMLRARRSVELDQQLRSEALMSLIDGTGNADLARTRLRVSPGEPRALLAFGFTDAAHRAPGPTSARAAQEVARQVVALRPGAAVAVSSSAIYVFLADSSAGKSAALLADSITSVSGRVPGARLVGAVAADPHADRELTELRAEADDVLAALLGGADRTVATLNDVRAQVLLRHALAEFTRHPWLLDPRLTEVFDSSARSRELVTSVAAWFDARFEISRAAQELQVHANTLRYRLRRFSELTGVDLEDADALLSLWLQMRTHAESAAARSRPPR